jgi:hypothetical protein
MSATSQPNPSRKAKWAVRILTLLIILSFVPSAIMKLILHPQAATGFSEMGIPPEAIIPIGVVELLCLAIYLVPQTTVLGAVLLTGYLGGATLANIIGGTDFIHALVIGVMVWAVEWFQVPEIQRLVPTRKTGPGA